MKNTFLLLGLVLIASGNAVAQNVGIGTTTPANPLEVSAHGRTGIFSYTDSAMGPGFSYANYNNAPAGIRGEYRGVGLNHGSGLVGTALSTQAGYGNGVTGKGGYSGLMGIGSIGGHTGVYAAGNGATWGLYVEGNSNLLGNLAATGNTSLAGTLGVNGAVKLDNYRGNGIRPLQVDDSGRVIVALPGTVFSNATSMSIPDNGCATTTGINSTIIVSGQPATIHSDNIAVMVNIDHPYDADLKILLRSPEGYTVPLAVTVGGNGDHFVNTIFSDIAPAAINTGVAPFEGSYKPYGYTVANYNCGAGGGYSPAFSGLGAGGNPIVMPNGTWTLIIYDAATGDIGTLKNWSISFNGISPLVVSKNKNRLAKFNGNGGMDASSMMQNAATGRIGISSNQSFQPNAVLDVDGKINSTGASIAGDVGVAGNLLATGAIATDAGLTVSDNIEVNGNAIIGGTVKIGGGSPGAGKVLTSNATGDAAWQSTTSPSATTGFLAGYKSGAALSFPSGTDQLLAFADNVTGIPNMAPFDDGNNFDNSTAEYTAPSVGFYQFTTKVRFQPPAGLATQNGLITLTLYKNGNFYCLWFVSIYSGQSVPLSIDGTTNLKLAAGDKIKVKVSQSSGQTLDIWNAADTQFSGYKIY